MPQFNPRDTSRARQLRHAATPAERHLWHYLSRSQLGSKFSRQMPVGPYFADFLCREHSLIVEVDGHSHDVRPQRDIVRDAALMAAGYRVLHFSNLDVMQNTEAVLGVIRDAIESRAHP